MFFSVKQSIRSFIFTLSIAFFVSLLFRCCGSVEVYEHSVWYPATVQFVVDGDTLVLLNQSKVRLVGIDTPESYFSDKLSRDSQRLRQSEATIMKRGQYSKQVVQQLLSSYKKVGIVYDSFSEHSYFKDKYGRYLAYVYIPLESVVLGRLEFWEKSGLVREYQGKQYVCLNAYLLYLGLACVYRRFDFDKKKEFLFLEREAQKRQKGHWKEKNPF